MRCERDIIIAANMIIYDDQRGLHLLDVGVLEHGLVGDVHRDHVQLGRVLHLLPSDLLSKLERIYLILNHCFCILSEFNLRL